MGARGDGLFAPLPQTCADFLRAFVGKSQSND
jgi:hypothetical protein